MAYCNQCGAQMADSQKFCPSCGTASAPAATEQPASEPANAPGNTFSKLNETADTTADYGKADIEQNKVMALLSYFGILVLVPILAAKESAFARFHANQGLVLFIAMIGWIIADSILTAVLRAILWRGIGLWGLYSLCATLLNLVYIAFAVWAVIGILNAWNGRAKELPLIGKYKLLK